MTTFSGVYGYGKWETCGFKLPNVQVKYKNNQRETSTSSKKLDSAAKINIALSFVLRNIETGKNRFFYAQEIDTFFEKFHLLCTKADSITIQGK